MERERKKAVLFDCWDTLITFREKVRTWNVEPLKAHCVNKGRVDFSAVEDYSATFLRTYMQSRIEYEIQAEQLLRLLCLNFDIELDCDVSLCVHEILTHLDPEPVEGVKDFLSVLDRKDIPYAILSNTIYEDGDTEELVRRLIPEGRFAFFLGSGSVGVKKPNPLFFHTGTHLLHVRPEDTLYVGDSFYADVAGANRAKMNNAVWLNPKRKTTDFFKPLLPDYESLAYEDCTGYADVIRLLEEGRLFR